MRVLGRVMGIVLTADGVAEATAPMLVGYLRDRTGSYDAGFLVLVCAALRRRRRDLRSPRRGESARRRLRLESEVASLRQIRVASNRMRIVDGKVIVCSPGRNFVTLKLVDRGRRLRPRRRDAQRPRAGGCELSDRSRHPAAHRPRRAPDRGHLAVPLQGRVLAARSGHDVGDCRRRYGALGHPRQVAQRAGVSAARRRVARLGDGLRARQRIDASTTPSKRSAHYIVARLSGDPRAVRDSRPGARLRRRPRRRCTTSRRRRACRPKRVWSSERYLDFVPPLFERLRREFGLEVHLLHDVHHRLTPIEAGAARQEPRAVTTCSGWRIRRRRRAGAFRLIRQHTTTPIAVGEVFNTIHDCRS